MIEYYTNPKTQELISFDTDSNEATALIKIGEGGGLLKVKKAKKKEGNSEWHALDGKPKKTGRSLTPEVLTQIKTLLEAGKSVKEIEEETGVSNPTIYKIKNAL